MWTPCNRFDSGLMLAELERGFVVELFPYHQLVVVASRSKLLVFVIPFQTTDFLFVTHEFAKPLVRLPNITVIDGAIPRTRRKDVFIPRKGTNTSCVSGHGAKSSLSLRIPDLHLTTVRANRNM